jgi:hypothetical protein
VYALPYVLLIKLHQAAIDARRQNRTWRYLAWSAAAGLAIGISLAIAIGFVAILWIVGLEQFAIPAAAIMIVPLVAGPIARRVFVPFGMYRTAYYAGLVSRPGADAPAYSLCLAAWAYGCMRPDHRGAAEVWIAAKRDERTPLGDAEVASTGLLLAGKGDADAARKLLRSTAMLVENHPSVRELVGEWLAVDAAERAAWRELVDDAAAARWPASPLTFFLEGVASRRIEAAGAPGRRELILRWLFAPHRIATRALLADPVAPPSPRPSAEGDAPMHAANTPHLSYSSNWARAVAAHLAFKADVPSASGLEATVIAWDTALGDAGTHTWLARRALELDAPAGAVDRAIRDVATAISDELARLAEHAKLGAPTSKGPVGNELARRLRHGRLDALESAFTRWADRRRNGEVYSAIDEWREFVALHASYLAAVTAGGTELRRLAFPHAFSTGSNMAAWLWNTRNEYAVSHAISRWLLSEALAVGDTEAIELGHRNCALSVPTRLGNVKP